MERVTSVCDKRLKKGARYGTKYEEGEGGLFMSCSHVVESMVYSNI